VLSAWSWGDPRNQASLYREFVCPCNNLSVLFTPLYHGILISQASLSWVCLFLRLLASTEFSKMQFKARKWLRGKPQLAKSSGVNTSCLSSPIRIKPKKDAVAQSPVQTPLQEMLQGNRCISQPSQFYFSDFMMPLIYQIC